MACSLSDTCTSSCPPPIRYLRHPRQIAERERLQEARVQWRMQMEREQAEHEAEAEREATVAATQLPAAMNHA